MKTVLKMLGVENWALKEHLSDTLLGTQDVDESGDLVPYVSML